MKREGVVWTVLFVVGGLLLLLRAGMSEQGMAKAYIRAVEMEFVDVGPLTESGEKKWISVDSDAALDFDLSGVSPDERISWTRYEEVTPLDYHEAVEQDPSQTSLRLSPTRTFGIWVSAFFTLAIFSFLYKDNPVYRIAEATVVGVSAAYWMVVGFWDVIVPNLFGKIWPSAIKAWAMPGLDAHPEYLYLAPLALGVMLIWRLAPKGGWIARWPMSFIIGIFCGLRLISFLHADFLSQIRNSIQSLWVLSPDGAFLFWDSLRAVVLVVGVLACIVYFFFSIEHRGFVGKTARVGIWVLMVTFGAAFGYTVMGRIALLAIRLEYLFDDWLWLIDPIGRRISEASALLGGVW